MTSGSRPPVPNPTYPERSLQGLLGGPWWEYEESNDIRRGRLLWVFAPHVGVEPWTLEPLGRSEPTQHGRINYRLQSMSAHRPPQHPGLPVAAWPAFENEVLTAYRAKRRPAVIVSCGGIDVPEELRKAQARWTTAQTLLVAPYYGATASANRAGWPEPLVTRIKECEYPQFLWDLVPTKNPPVESILMLNRIQPIGDHRNSVQVLPYTLSGAALEILDEWIVWLATETMEEDGMLPMIQRELKGLA
jgi:hypothetical protein